MAVDEIPWVFPTEMLAAVDTLASGSFAVCEGLSSLRASLGDAMTVSEETEPGLSFPVEDFRSLKPGTTVVSLLRFLFRALTAHEDSVDEPLVGLPVSAEAPAGDVSFNSALSASSCCRRNKSSCSVVSFLTASSLALVDSSTESRNSTSSSSRVRNWFFRRTDSSNASCFAAR